MIPPSFSVEAIEQALSSLDPIDAHRFLLSLCDALQSGEVAILSREDRENAYQYAWASGYQNHSNESGEGWRTDKAEARTLLKLDGGTTP